MYATVMLSIVNFFLVRIEFYWVCFRLGLFLRQFLVQVGLKLHIQWRVTLNF